MIDIAQVQGQVHAQSVQKVGDLADKNPNETVSIIRILAARQRGLIENHGLRQQRKRQERGSHTDIANVVATLAGRQSEHPAAAS